MFRLLSTTRFSVVIGRFRSILFVSVFHGSLAVAIIMIYGSEKPNRQLGFELHSSHVIKKTAIMMLNVGILLISDEMKMLTGTWL